MALSFENKERLENLVSQKSKRPKRSKLEIFFDVLHAIREEISYGEVKPTRIQYISNLSYDNLILYLEELASKNMITRKPLALTEKGIDFLNEYDKVHEFVKKLGLEYL